MFIFIDMRHFTWTSYPDLDSRPSHDFNDELRNEDLRSFWINDEIWRISDNEDKHFSYSSSFPTKHSLKLIPGQITLIKYI